MEIEVPDVETAVRPLPSREAARDIGDPIEVNIMQHDERIIAARDHVLLEVIGTHGIGERFGRQCVLGQVARRAAVRNDHRPHGRINIK